MAGPLLTSAFVVSRTVRLVRPLSRGAMAEVWLAHEESAQGFSRPIVVKRIRDEWHADPEVRALFAHEARLLALLRHPHIVSVHGVAEIDGALAILLELVEGLSIEAILARRTIPIDAALEIARAISSALVYAHGAKGPDGTHLEVVHRDLHPGNVIVREDGCVKLLDFGIARARSQMHATATGVVRGTEGFIAPEVLRGERPTSAADVFGLGVLLARMVEGNDDARLAPYAPWLASLVAEDPAARPTLSEVERSLAHVLGQPASATRSLWTTPDAHGRRLVSSSQT